jgi:hypothetical protein
VETGLLENDLIELAVERCVSDDARAKVMREIKSPNFASFIERENWKYLIPESLAGVWDTLPYLTQLAVYVVAKNGIECGPCID